MIQSSSTDSSRFRHITPILDRLFQPVDIAGLVYFRVVFSLLMSGMCIRYVLLDKVGLHYLDTAYLFTYLGFSWVHPWPGIGLYVHFIALGAVALCMALGLFYRLNAALLFLGFTYVFLLDQARYLNHFYLICLLSFLMIFLPAHRAGSLDVLRKPALRTNTTPAWTFWILLGQIGIVYFLAGVAKANPDWILGEPLRTWMQNKTGIPVVGPLFTREWVIYAMSYGALVIDLLTFPLLLCRRTRVVAFCVVVFFHLCNSVLFAIGVFPWLMIASTALFFGPAWPRRIPRVDRWLRGGPELSISDSPGSPHSTRRRELTLALLAIYAGFQVLVPLRHYVYPGDASWTEEGHRFAWRMLLRTKDSWVRFTASNPETGKTIVIRPRDYLKPRQARKMASVPDMTLQFAHFLADELSRQGHADMEIRARASVSLNARPHQLIIDPEVDLARVSRLEIPASWILPLETPLEVVPGEPSEDAETGWPGLHELAQPLFGCSSSGAPARHSAPER